MAAVIGGRRSLQANSFRQPEVLLLNWHSGHVTNNFWKYLKTNNKCTTPDDAVLVAAAAAAGRPAGGLAVAGLGPAARPAQLETAGVEAALPRPRLVHVRLDEDAVLVPGPPSLSLVLSVVEEPPREAAVVHQGRRLGGRAVELGRGRVPGRGGVAGRGAGVGGALGAARGAAAGPHVLHAGRQRQVGRVGPELGVIVVVGGAVVAGPVQREVAGRQPGGVAVVAAVHREGLLAAAAAVPPGPAHCPAPAPAPGLGLVVASVAEHAAASVLHAARDEGGAGHRVPRTAAHPRLTLCIPCCAASALCWSR